MNLLITGGTGFVGSRLCEYFLRRGHRVTALGTRSAPNLVDHADFRYISANTTQKGPWQEALKQTDVVINLAGRSIFGRWSKRVKKQIYDSRILTTRNVVKALPAKSNVTLLSASGIGYYGNRGDDLLKEIEPNAGDFLAGISREWEAEALRAREKGARVVTARFGVVLGKGGGAMEKMIPAFRYFMGGSLGSGRQWFPWIHLKDLCAAMNFAIDNEVVDGPVNFCAPTPVRQRDFAKTLGKVLEKPAVMPAPGFLMRLVLGEFGDSLLFSQRAVPDKLLSSGFRFEHPELESALRDIVETRLS